MGDSFFVDARPVDLHGIAATLFELRFGAPSDNTKLVVDAAAAIDASITPATGGPLALISGPASLPVIATIVHKIAHRFGALAIYDPKLGSFIVAVTHGPGYVLGQSVTID